MKNREDKREPLWRPILAKALPGSEPHCCCYLWRRADNSRQAARSSRCETQVLYSGTLLRCGFAMPARYRTCADLNHWHDLSRQTESRPTPRKSTSRVASVLFLDGLASKAEQRSAACVASRGDAINNRGSGWVSVLGKKFSLIDFPNFERIQQDK